MSSKANYKEILSVFKTKANESGRATDKIFDQVYATMAVQPHNYLMMTVGEPNTNGVSNYHIQVIHRPSVYTVPMRSMIPSLQVPYLSFGEMCTPRYLQPM
jgi:hypothetical protein